MKILPIMFRRAQGSRARAASATRIAIGAMTAIVCLVAVPGAPAIPAQDSPPPPDINGNWFNPDPHTRGLVKIEIKGRAIHPYGTCSPSPCDWGVMEAKPFSAGVDSQETSALLARRKTDIEEDEIILSLEPDGRLRVEVLTQFTDRSSRTDFRIVDCFVRGRVPYNP